MSRGPSEYLDFGHIAVPKLEGGLDGIRQADRAALRSVLSSGWRRMRRSTTASMVVCFYSEWRLILHRGYEYGHLRLPRGNPLYGFFKHSLVGALTLPHQGERSAPDCPRGVVRYIFDDLSWADCCRSTRPRSGSGEC